MRQLEGRVAIVTGGATGIGRATCIALARAGASVVVNYCRSEADALEVVANIRRAGYPDAVAVSADISSRPEVANLMESACASFGGIDVLINNAGVSLRARLLDIDDATWRTVLDVNLTSTFLCCQAVLPIMRRRGSGRIVNVSSVAGLLAMPGAPHYSAAKAGVLGLMRSIAEDLAPDILVNAVAPGWIDTRMNASEDQNERRETARQTPLGRWGRSEEIAETIAFLASAQNFMTGQILVADGGLGNVYSAL
jgi:3-oxoacyl-[acyl-carrier protein] reductase